MLQALRFMSVRQKLCYNVCISTFKILNNVFPEALRNKLGIVGSDKRKANKTSWKYRNRFPWNKKSVRRRVCSMKEENCKTLCQSS
jgi:hypothetical protein